MIETNQLACSPEYQILRKQYDMLIVAYTTLVSQYQNITDHEAPHLSALYMHYFDKLLYIQLRLGLSIAVLHLRHSLLQAYINRDQTPDLVEIDKQTAQQRLEYHRLLEQRLDQLKAAQAYWNAPCLTPEESKGLKETYKTLVKQLHLDLNPHYAEGDKKFFPTAVKAYRACNLQQLQAILALVDKGRPVDIPLGSESFSVEIERLQKKMRLPKAKFLRRSSSFPFDQKELLVDPVAVQERQVELQAIIKELEESEQEMQTIVPLMEEYKSRDL